MSNNQVTVARKDFFLFFIALTLFFRTTIWMDLCALKGIRYVISVSNAIIQQVII